MMEDPMAVEPPAGSQDLRASVATRDGPHGPVDKTRTTNWYRDDVAPMVQHRHTPPDVARAIPAVFAEPGGAPMVEGV